MSSRKFKLQSINGNKTNISKTNKDIEIFQDQEYEYILINNKLKYKYVSKFGGQSNSYE